MFFPGDLPQVADQTGGGMDANIARDQGGFQHLKQFLIDTRVSIEQIRHIGTQHGTRLGQAAFQARKPARGWRSGNVSGAGLFAENGQHVVEVGIRERRSFYVIAPTTNV
jgi:hypothetical protein